MERFTATEQDRDAVYRLLCILEETDFDYSVFADHYAKLLSDPDTFMFIAKDREQVLGFLDMRVQIHLHHLGNVAEILELVVAPGARSRGVGKYLFEGALACAKKQRCVSLELSSNMRRKRAHSFYERLGMVKSHCRLTMQLEPDKI